MEILSSHQESDFCGSVKAHENLSYHEDSSIRSSVIVLEKLPSNQESDLATFKNGQEKLLLLKASDSDSQDGAPKIQPSSQELDTSCRVGVLGELPPYKDSVDSVHCSCLTIVTKQVQLPPYQETGVCNSKLSLISSLTSKTDASATVLGAATAAFPLLSLVGKIPENSPLEDEDPLLKPIVQQLRSTAIATIEVSQSEHQKKKKRKLSRKMSRRKSKTKLKKKSSFINAYSPSIL